MQVLPVHFCYATVCTLTLTAIPDHLFLPAGAATDVVKVAQLASGKPAYKPAYIVGPVVKALPIS